MNLAYFRKRRTIRWLGPVIIALSFSLVALWGASRAQTQNVDGIYPSQLVKLRSLLIISGIWLAALSITVLLSRFFRSEKADGVTLSPSLPVRQRRGIVVLVILVVGYIMAYGWLSIARHERFNSTGFDLAIKEQVIWNTAHGRFFASSPEVDNAFADHFQPLMLALLPFYIPAPSPEMLLWIQTIGLSLGALPLYRLAQRRLNSTGVALALTAAYLAFPALGFINRFDFHPEALAITAFLFAFESLDRDDLTATSLWLLVPLLAKENLGFSVALFGLYAAIVYRHKRFGVLWAVTGIAVSGLTMFWLIPTLRQGPSDTLSRYGWLGESPTAILRTLLTRPGYVWQRLAEPNRALYLLQLLAPTGFLALLALPELLLAVPGLAINLLANHHCQPQIYCQYGVPIVPFVFIAAVIGLQKLKAFLNHKSSWTILGLAIVPLTLLALMLDNPFRESQMVPPPLQQLSNAEAVYRALDAVPPDASVVTTNAYAPHLARRQGLYIIGIPAQREPPIDPDVVFINLYDQRFMLCDQYREYFSQLDLDRYGTLFRDSGLIVIQRDGGSNAGFRDFMLNWTNCAG
jgi:uncharacterized membrane protein